MFFTLVVYDCVSECLWIGTAPFCGASTDMSDCKSRNMGYGGLDKSGDGATCWDGWKVCCK